MRVTMTVREDSSVSSVLIWAESKSTKAQWQLEVKDVAKHGPGGLPSNVVFNVLKAIRNLLMAICFLDAFLTNGVIMVTKSDYVFCRLA